MVSVLPLLLFDRVGFRDLRRNLFRLLLPSNSIRISLLLSVGLGNLTFSQRDHLLNEPP